MMLEQLPQVVCVLNILPLPTKQDSLTGPGGMVPFVQLCTQWTSILLPEDSPLYVKKHSTKLVVDLPCPAVGMQASTWVHGPFVGRRAIPPCWTVGEGTHSSVAGGSRP